MKALYASLLLVTAIACSDGKGSVTSPSAAPAARLATPAKFSLDGRVVASRTFSPIAGARVAILTGPDAGKSATTDAAGYFMFSELETSSAIVDVSAPEYGSGRAQLVVNVSRMIILYPLGPSIVLEGRVTDAITSAAVAGATVYINGRYRATTDASGGYTLTGYLDNGDGSIVWANADGYEVFVRYIQANSAQSFQLRPIERITAGETWTVTVRPDDSLCFNNLQDPSFGLPGSGFRCRTVRVISPVNGVVTLEAISTEDGSRPPLEVELRNSNPCCFEGLGNPRSLRVRAGMEAIVNVEIPERATASQSFIVTASMVPE